MSERPHVFSRTLLSRTERWFAWRPVKLQVGGWVWLRFVQRHQVNNGMRNSWSYDSWWVYDLKEQCLRGELPKRSYKWKGDPLDFNAADDLAAKGVRLDDVINEPASRRKISGIAVYGLDRVSISYTEGAWGE